MNCNNIEDRVALVTANINEYTTLNYPAKELLFIMTSKNSGGDGFQKAISWTSKREWNRILQNGVWEDWYELATKSDLTSVPNTARFSSKETLFEFLRNSPYKILYLFIDYTDDVIPSAGEMIYIGGRDGNVGHGIFYSTYETAPIQIRFSNLSGNQYLR